MKPKRNPAVRCSAWLGHGWALDLFADCLMECTCKMLGSGQITPVPPHHNETLGLFFWIKNLRDRVSVKLQNALAWILIHNGDCHRVVWTDAGRLWIGGINGLTTQAQRPGPRDAWIATATRWPGSLQRMVRPRFHALK